MKSMFAVILAFVLACSSALAGECTIDQSLATSVTIKTTGGQGSGTLFTDGDKTYVWTAGHVVEDLRRTRQDVDDEGNPITIVEFSDAQIVQEFVENGRRVGEVVVDAQVLHYSDAEDGRDLAILQIRKSNFTTLSTNFYTHDTPVDVGTEVYHVGSLRGQFGANSYTTGVISSVGRVLDLEGNGVVFDQTTVTAFPGSSGGGVYKKDTGEYVGMLVRGSGEQFNFIVPVREMRAWCDENDLQWALPNEIVEEPSPTPAEPVSPVDPAN